MPNVCAMIQKLSASKSTKNAARIQRAEAIAPNATKHCAPPMENSTNWRIKELGGWHVTPTRRAMPDATVRHVAQYKTAPTVIFCSGAIGAVTIVVPWANHKKRFHHREGQNKKRHSISRRDSFFARELAQPQFLEIEFRFDRIKHGVVDLPRMMQLNESLAACCKRGECRGEMLAASLDQYLLVVANSVRDVDSPAIFLDQLGVARLTDIVE